MLSQLQPLFYSTVRLPGPSLLRQVVPGHFGIKLGTLINDTSSDIRRSRNYRDFSRVSILRTSENIRFSYTFALGSSQTWRLDFPRICCIKDFAFCWMSLVDDYLDCVRDAVDVIRSILMHVRSWEMHTSSVTNRSTILSPLRDTIRDLHQSCGTNCPVNSFLIISTTWKK